jgi:broad-specificity NMP kinase
MKYLITGFPGTGKSTVSDELERRGFKSYNTDDIPGFSHFIDRKTKQSLNKPADAPSDWNVNHDWVWENEKIEGILNQKEDAFICAITPSQVSYYSRFDKIFVLTLGEKSLRHRLANRTSNDYGKKSEELNHILQNYKKFGNNLAKNHRAILIDASQPLNKVVDEILSHIDEN